MAWQLIYTSAPRLLEAGLTGFGTVARHRAIPPLVVKAVERIGQFARQPGYDPARIIYSHRVLTVGDSRFHVLSRLCDAGADYSGRTNHIAHHVIAPAAEISQTAITPMDFYWQFAWCNRWDGAPIWLESAEEISMANLSRAEGRDGAWAEITGKSDHRWLLVNGAASKGCCLIAPSHQTLLALFTESQHCQAAGQSWQTGFTTAVQPTDDLGDYRWIGVLAESPLRQVMESSGRELLDLTAPHTLPEPELPPIVAQPDVPQPNADQGARDVAPTHSPSQVGTAKNKHQLGKYSPPRPPHSRSDQFNSPSSAPAGWGLNNPPRTTGKPRLRWWALAGAVVVVGSFSIYLYQSRPKNAVPPLVGSTALQQEVTNAKTAQAIRVMQVPEEDRDTVLGKLINKVVKEKPTNFGDCVKQLKDINEPGYSQIKENVLPQHWDKIITLLENEAWDLCLKKKPSIEDFSEYKWKHGNIGQIMDHVKKYLNNPTSVKLDDFPDGKAPDWMKEPAKEPAKEPDKPTDKPTDSPPAKDTAKETAPPPIVTAATTEKLIGNWEDDVDLSPDYLKINRIKIYGESGDPFELKKRDDNSFRKGGVIGGLEFTIENGKLKKKSNEPNYPKIELINKAGEIILTIKLKTQPTDSPTATATESSKTPPKQKESIELKYNSKEGTITLVDYDKFLKNNNKVLYLKCPFPVGKDSKSASQKWEYTRLENGVASFKHILDRFEKLKTINMEKLSGNDIDDWIKNDPVLKPEFDKRQKSIEKLNKINTNYNESLEKYTQSFKDAVKSEQAKTHPLIDADDKLPPGQYAVLGAKDENAKTIMRELKTITIR